MNETTPNASSPISRRGRRSAYARSLFSLGRLLATPAALAHLEGHSVSPADLLRKHGMGDWGDLCAEDKAANVSALKHGARIFSAYEVAGQRIYVITEAESETGLRAATTILLAEEY